MKKTILYLIISLLLICPGSSLGAKNGDTILKKTDLESFYMIEEGHWVYKNYDRNYEENLETWSNFSRKERKQFEFKYGLNYTNRISDKAFYIIIMRYTFKSNDDARIHIENIFKYYIPTLGGWPKATIKGKTLRDECYAISSPSAKPGNPASWNLLIRKGNRIVRIIFVYPGRDGLVFTQEFMEDIVEKVYDRL